MATVLVRRFLGLVMTVAVGLLPVVPPEHVHEVEEHGHLQLVVHRHLQSHEVATAGHSTAVDHDDAPIATLDQDFIVPATWHLDASVDREAMHQVVASTESRAAFSAFVERLIHAPPRGPTPDRGPPSVLAS